MIERKSRRRGLTSEVLSIIGPKSKLGQLLAVPLYRNALYLMVGSVLSGVVGLAFWMVAAKLHNADTIGLASATVSAMLLLSTLGTIGLDYAIIRFLPNSPNATSVVNTSLSVGALASTVVSLVFVAGLSFWSPVLLFLQRSALLFGGFVVFTVAYTLYLIQSRTFVARRRAEFSLVQNVVFNVLRIGLLVVLAVWFGTFGIVSAWGAATVVALGVGVFVLQGRLEAGYRPGLSISRGVLDQLVRYSFSNYIAVMLWAAPGYVLPLVVANLVGADSNAYFYVAWSMANVLFQVPLAISLSLFAEGSCDEETLGQNIRKSLKFTFLIVIPGIAFFVGMADTLLGYFEPQYAEDAAWLLRILAISAIPLAISSTYFMVERVKMRMGRVILMNAFVTLGTLGLSWALLPRMGLTGVGVAWIASQSAAAMAVVANCLACRRPRPRATV